MPVSFLVHCRQADLTKVGGEAFDLTTAGIAIKTNCPISKGDQLSVEFLMPNTLNCVKVKGEVTWRRFHGDTPGEEETLFTAGIKFLHLEEITRASIWDFIRSSKTSTLLASPGLSGQAGTGHLNTSSEEAKIG